MEQKVDESRMNKTRISSREYNKQGSSKLFRATIMTDGNDTVSLRRVVRSNKGCAQQVTGYRLRLGLNPQLKRLSSES